MYVGFLKYLDRIPARRSYLISPQKNMYIQFYFCTLYIIQNFFLLKLCLYDIVA